ncbi:MAG: peptidoglycan DD-metalloendopeptidase family protein [Treponema sp.]|nr:peptidoglycan DD-metalloendopeptidase family protein [Treponema sp.]
MKNEVQKTSLITVLLCVCAVAWTMEWPLPEAELIRNFGYNDRGRPVLGFVFEGDGQVLAADTGELIFSRSEKNTASRLPSALGAWSAIDHGDGLVSIYGRYKDEDTVQPRQRVNTGMPVATAGRSGWSGRDGLYFMLYDRRERRWVNASMVINPLPDTQPPQIFGVQLRNTGNMTEDRVIEVNQLRNIGQGRYAVSVNTIDTQFESRGLPLAPHRIVCSINGEEVGVLSFETISTWDGRLMVNRNGLFPAQRVYANPFEIAEVQFNRGQAQLEIIVYDIAGNSQNTNVRIIID